MKVWNRWKDKLDRWSVLDERQQAELNRIGSNGYGLAFALLLIALIIQAFVLDYSFKEIAGEWIVFMILAVYMVVGCVKAGIWTAHTQEPKGKDFLITSIFGSLIFAVIFSLDNYRRAPEASRTILDWIYSFLLWFFILFAAMFVSLLVTGSIYKKHRKNMERKLEEEMEDDEK